jgi:Na+/proline symporter
VIIGVVYLSLAFSAAELLVDLPGQASGGDRDSAKDWTAWLLAQPFGQWLAGGAGAVVIFSALFHFYRAATADFCEKLKLGQLGDEQIEWVKRLGRLGFAARGVAFAIIGGFLVLAAIRSNPQEARGLDGALATLASQPYGPWLLGAVAAGLLAYGLYMFVEARYRRMVIR